MEPVYRPLGCVGCCLRLTRGRMETPEGLTEEQVLKSMDRVVNYLAPSFKFGYYDIDDMKQEGRIFCLEVLPKFDFNKSIQKDRESALTTYFKVTVRRLFINMRRDKFQRIEPPNCKCELCKSDDAERLNCKKYSSWIQRNLSKRSLVEPFDVDNVYTSEVSSTKQMEESVMSSEVLCVLDKHMPARSRGDYRRFIEGVRLTKDKRERVIIQIKAVLSKHYSEEAEEWNFE